MELQPPSPVQVNPKPHSAWFRAKIILALLLLLTAGVIAYWLLNANRRASVGNQLQVVFGTKPEDHSEEDFPFGFRHVVKPITVTQDFTSDTGNGTKQSTFAYSTSIAVADVVSAYTNFFALNSWEIKSNYSDNRQSIIVAFSGQRKIITLQISTEADLTQVKAIYLLK